MKFLLPLLILVSCATKKSDYTGNIQFEADGKEFKAQVELPKKFDQKLPLVVIIHEWWGRNDYVFMRSNMLKEKGYATLVVDLYGNNQVVETPKEAMELATPFYQNPELGINRLNQFIASAKKDPHIDENKIYVIGYCFGGTQALNLARSGAEVKGVVSFHGGLKTSYQAKTLKAKVLAINGLADPMVPAEERAAFEKEMSQLKADYKMKNYKNATHAFTNPKATEVGKKYNIPVAYNKKADEGSWVDLLNFLK